MTSLLFLAQAGGTQEIPQVSPFAVILCLAVIAFFIAVMWKVYAKAGRPGWASLVPIYNVWVLLEMGGKPGWWMFVPFANIVFLILATLEIARRFGKSTAFGLGLIFLGGIFYAILAFGDAKYQATPETT